MDRTQAKLETRLAQEIEKNKDNLAETEALQVEYRDREAQYEVRSGVLFLRWLSAIPSAGCSERDYQTREGSCCSREGGSEASREEEACRFETEKAKEIHRGGTRSYSS